MEKEENTVVDINPDTQPIAYAQQTRADRLREASNAPDFSIPEVRPIDAIFSESSMNMTPDMVEDMMRETGIYASTGKQTATAIKNAFIGMNQMGDEIKISYGNLANYFTGSSVGDEMAQIAYESIAQRYGEMANSEEAIGGIRSNLAQLAGGATSFLQLALEGIATAGVLPLAHIGVQEFGQGTYNDMKAYADEHDGSLSGYQPKGFDLAANTANALLQVGIERWLGVGSPRFMVGASRGLWAEGLSGALQEGVQGALHDLNEAIKGNEDISILLDNAEDYLRDAIVGGILQGGLGAVTHHQNYARAVNNTSEAIAKARGHEEPTVEDKQQAQAIIDAKEREEASILTKEFKAAFDASSGEGQLQRKIVDALNAAVKNKELDFDTADETELAQRIEQIATQETMNTMDLAREQSRSIADMELNNIVYKDGAIWLEGLTPQVGDRAVSYARVLAERQSGLAEVNSKLDAINQEIATLKQDLAEAKAENKQAQVEKLQARIDKQNALAEKNRLQAERLKVQTAKLEKQIAKQEEKAKIPETVKTEKVSAEVKPVEEPKREVLAQVKKKEPVTERKSLKEERVEKKKTKAEKMPAQEQLQMSFDLADENARLDDIYPEYTGETIEVDGKERTVYNSNGDRIAKSKEALTNFWRWFGNSKAVDEEGHPLVVYHGTDAEFDTFDRFKRGKNTQVSTHGFYFTDNTEVSRTYGTKNMPVYLKTNKPYIIDYLGAFHTGILPKGQVAVALKDNYNAMLNGTYDVKILPYPEATKFVEENEEYTITNFPFWNTGETSQFAQENGYDGVIFKNIRDAVHEENLVSNVFSVFEPNQIKSVDNRGTYSEKTGNILKQGSTTGKGDTNRGGYDDALKRIILGEKSDLSTIQHEFAHYWMQNNFKWARSGLASQDWLRRWRDVEEWLGIEPQDRLLSKSASEKFAKAYERYILEGKVAPELQWAFEGFRKAYQDIYEDLENEYFDLSEELAPEVVDWFNRNKEQSPKRMLQSDEQKIEKALTLAAGGAVVEQAGTDAVVMTENNEKGEPVVTMGVKQSEVPAGDNLLVYSDKATASKLQQSARKVFGEDVEVQKLATLDTQATLENFTNWIKRDRAGAWDAMMDPSTSPIYQAYLYKAFAQEAMNDVNLAVELANVDIAKAAREMGQAVQALNINNESGFDMLEIIRNLEKSKGTVSEEELNNSVAEIGLDNVELSQEEVDELENQTECKL